MARKSFANTVKAWTAQTLDTSTEIARESVAEFVAEYKAAAPHDTGNLANSITVAANPHNLVKGEPNQKYAPNDASNHAVIEAMELGDHVFVAALAPYNAKQEFGHVGSDGKHVGKFFGTRTAAAWSSMVKRVARAKGMRTK